MYYAFNLVLKNASYLSVSRNIWSWKCVRISETSDTTNAKTNCSGRKKNCVFWGYLKVVEFKGNIKPKTDVNESTGTWIWWFCQYSRKLWLSITLWPLLHNFILNIFLLAYTFWMKNYKINKPVSFKTVEL